VFPVPLGRAVVDGFEHVQPYLQSTLDILSMPIAILDHLGTIQAVNNAWRSVVEPKAFLGACCGVGENYLTFCDQIAAHGSKEALNLASGIRVVTSRSRTELVLEYVGHHAGEEQWFLARVSHFDGPNGSWVVLAHEDMSKHRQIENPLRESEEKFRGLVAGSRQGILIVQQDKPVFVNQAFAELHGYDSPVDIYQLSSLFDLIAPHDHERMKQYHIDRLMGKTVPNHDEFQGLKRDGTLIWLEAVARLVTWHEAPAIQLTVIDKTASREAEQALQRADRLAMLGRMAATFSHEVRNPLQSLRLYAEILEEEVAECVPDTQVASRKNIDYALTVIREEATRMSDIVQDYLSLARLGSLTRDPEDVGMLLLGVIKDQSEAFARRGITLQLEGIEGLGYALIHPSTFRRALFNLIQNAIDAIGANGCLTLLGREAQDQIQLDIMDTGPGIAPEVISDIFTPFHTTKTEGTGLGLYVVQEVITAHEGHIFVDSELGKGTTFTITLPRVEAGVTPPA
jgi:PAS domain S-box-containing protein